MARALGSNERSACFSRLEPVATLLGVRHEICDETLHQHCCGARIRRQLDNHSKSHVECRNE